MDLLPDVFNPAFAQRALLAIVVISIAGGVIGSWIVMHELAFFTHASAAGAYPLLILAPAGAVATEMYSFAGALLFAAAFFALARRTGERDLTAGLLLTTCIALGAVIQHARDGSRSVETLFFGSVLTVSSAALITLLIASAFSLGIAALMSQRWTAAAFDEKFSGVQAFALVLAIALLVAAALPALGALLVAALAVVPTATARLFARSLRSLIVGSVAISLVSGIGGLWLALQLDMPPGATVATLGFGIFLSVAAWRATISRRVSPAAAVALASCSLLIAGCGSNEKSADNEAPVAVASTPIVADLAAQVAGQGMRVETLLDASADPHHYEPRPSDLAKLAEARVVLRSGGDIDAWLPDAVEASGSDRRPVDLSSSAILLEHDGLINPHWFLNPANVVTAVERLRIEFTKAAPDHRETYRANAHRLAADHRRFDRWARRCLQSVPNGRRSIGAGHNAFDYLAERYQIGVVARLGGNDHEEPSAQAVREAIRTIREESVDVIAVVAGEDGGVAKEVARASGAELIELHGDTLPRGQSLLDAQYENVDRLARALGARQCKKV